MTEMNMNLFHVSINENYPRRLFIIPVSQNYDTLMLTDKSKPLFLRKFEDKFCDGMDGETYKIRIEAIAVTLDRYCGGTFHGS